MNRNTNNISKDRGYASGNSFQKASNFFQTTPHREMSNFTITS